MVKTETGGQTHFYFVLRVIFVGRVKAAAQAKPPATRPRPIARQTRKAVFNVSQSGDKLQTITFPALARKLGSSEARNQEPKQCRQETTVSAPARKLGLALEVVQGLEHLRHQKRTEKV
jgi:hypothetical protein